MQDCIILSHGAGSNRDAPLLVELDRVLCVFGLPVIRVNLPFRQSRPSGPPRPGDAERDRQGLRDAVTSAATQFQGRIFLGGHSYGARQSSMLAAEQPELVSGLLLLSYPLHPPRRPDQLRTAHFKSIHTPALFVHGTRDPFGSVEEMRAAIALIPGSTTLVEIPGAGHELARKIPALTEVAELIARQTFHFFNLASGDY